MEEYYFEVPVSNSKVLCIGSITDNEAEAVREDCSFCDGFGYYLFLADSSDPKTEVEILARLVSEEAAVRLGRALRSGGAPIAA